MIQARSLTRYYDGFCAVDRIDLDIDKGEVVGLLGPNGAGKTTTLRMLTGYLEPSAGRVLIDGRPLDEDPVEAKRRIGYLPESAPLYPSMLVYDFLLFTARLRGLDEAAAARSMQELADTCGIAEVMHKPIGHLSKGLRQRVGLAHAMMGAPDILVLDEPTSGLDPNQIVEIRRIIRQLGSQRTVILSTHILSEAEATCDRIVIIHKGKVIADGPTEQLTAKAEESSTVHLVVAGPTGQQAVELLRQLEAVAAVQASPAGDDTVRLQVQCAGEADPRPDLYRAVKQTDWVLLEMRHETRNLETIFRQLTAEE